MDRLIIMERYLSAAALGALSLLWWPSLPNINYLLMAALVFGLFALRWRVFALLTLCLLTTTWSVWCAQQALALQPPSTIEEKPFKVQVQIQGFQNIPLMVCVLE